jgi:cystathionine beta-lyase/cystathionine gamma-synthase
MRNLPTELAPGHLIRFAVGLEETADLQADIKQAMAKTLA